MKRYLKIFMTVVLLITVLGCKGRTDGPLSLKIAFDPWIGYAPVYVGWEKGIFKKNGVDVDFIYSDDTAVARDLFERGEVDVACEVFADVIKMASQGIGVKIAYVFDYSLKSDVIIGGKGINNISDLKNKDVGIDATFSFSHIFANQALQRAGIAEHEMRFRLVPFMGVEKGIESGEIAAGHTWDPVKSSLIAKGYKVLASAEDFPYLITDTLIVSDKSAQEKKEAVKKFIAGLEESYLYMKDNEAESISIIARKMGMSVDDTRRALNDIYILSPKDNEEIFKDPGRSAIWKMSKVIFDFYAINGLTSKSIQPGDVFMER